MKYNYTQRVENGAKWLDEFSPVDRWWDVIDLDLLYLPDGFYCVLGQVFGGFDIGNSLIYEQGREEVSLGFDVDFGENVEHAYKWLQRRWVTKIEQLRKERALAS